MNEIMTWWICKHWFLATVFTPEFTLIYAVWTRSWIWAVVSAIGMRGDAIANRLSR